MLTFKFKRAIIFQSLAFVYIKGQEDGWEASCYVPKTRLYLHFRGRGEVLASYVPFANVCDKLLEVWQMHRARGLIWDNLNIRECFLISLYAWPRWRSHPLGLTWTCQNLDLTWTCQNCQSSNQHLEHLEAKTI